MSNYLQIFLSLNPLILCLAQYFYPHMELEEYGFLLEELTIIHSFTLIAFNQ